MLSFSESSVAEEAAHKGLIWMKLWGRKSLRKEAERGRPRDSLPL